MKILKVTFILALFLLLTSPAWAQEITIVGTGSGPTILKGIAQKFMQLHPEIRISIPRSIGSNGGIKAVGTDQYQLGRVARMIKKSEQKYGLSYLPLASIPIAFYGNANITVKNLSEEQVCKIYSGSLYNWQKLGGHDARIRVIRRQKGEASLSILQRLLPGFDSIVMTDFSKITYTDPETIALAESTPDSIAFGAFCDVKERNVHIFTVNNRYPLDSSYPYYGTLALVYKEKNKKGAIGEFLAFATSPAAKEPIIRSGGIPINTKYTINTRRR